MVGVDGSNRTDIGVSWVVTDCYGLMLAASREAANMLNLSVAGLRSRQLLMFFDGEREHWNQALRAAASGLMVDREGAVRPRDRRPVLVRAEITRARDWCDGDALLWTFSEPESPEAAASSPEPRPAMAR